MEGTVNSVDGFPIGENELLVGLNALELRTAFVLFPDFDDHFTVIRGDQEIRGLGSSFGFEVVVVDTRRPHHLGEEILSKPANGVLERPVQQSVGQLKEHLRLFHDVGAFWKHGLQHKRF
jgi:hypothetical protein